MHQAAQILLEAVIIAMLVRIAVRDFTTQRIANRDTMLLAALGAAALIVEALRRRDQLQGDVWSELYLSLGLAAVLLLVLLPFWSMRKVGAGDVKLMAVTPLVAGASEMFTFAVALMGFALLTAFLIKNPLLLPAPVFRQYVVNFGRRGLVPYGVPICAALLLVELLRALR